MIFVSSAAGPKTPAYETAERFIAAGISCIELSGGLYTEDLFDKLKKMSKTCTFQVHNYFPPPPEPFVLNLASLDAEVAEMSLKHCKTSMRWAMEFGRGIYSVHAGFLIDPKVSQLGKRIAKQKLYPRAEALHQFLGNVEKLALYGKEIGCDLLLENNVLSLANMEEFGEDPLLMTSADEAVFIMENTSSNVNILIDVAHLIVSSHSLKFNPIEMLEKCEPWIRAYHLSDNDGTRDSNDPVTESSWFWPYLKRGLNYYSLEIYKNEPTFLAGQLALTKQILDIKG